MAKVILKETVADFAAAEDNLERIRTFVRDRLVETPLSKKDVTGLLLAVEEAVTNIIRHGYLYAEGTVRLRIAHDRRRVTLSLIDTGRPFSWPQPGSVDYEKMVETSRKGGLGVMLIQRVCDAVDYRRTPAGENELVLTKAFAEAPRRGGHGLSLRWRWTLAGMGVSTAVAVAFVAVAGFQGRANLRESFFGGWTGLVRTAASASANLILNRATDAEFDELAFKLAATNRSVRSLVITDTRGMILADTRHPEKVRTLFQLPADIQGDLDAVVQPAGPQQERTYYVTVPVLVERQALGRVHLVADGGALAAQQRDLRRKLALFALGGMAALWGLSLGLSGWFVRPLKRLSGSIRGGDQPETVRGGDEVQEIMDAFKGATRQIHQAERDHFAQELARREWEAAEQLQKALVMSAPPRIPGYEVGTFYRSAKYVGGDWYDVFPIDKHTFVLSVADVSGKGIPGALVMASVRTAVRLLAEKHREPAPLLCAVNTFAAGALRSGMFITMLLAVVDTRTHTVRFASAGHTPLLFYRRAEKSVFEVNPRGWPLGMQLPAEASFEQRLESGNLPLAPGDVFMLYTDGITEARNASKEFFGAQRLKSILAENQSVSAERLSEIIAGKLGEFTAEGSQQDDIAAVVVKRSLPLAETRDDLQPEPIFHAEPLDTPARRFWAADAGDPVTRELLRVVAHHPEFDAPQICLELGREEYRAMQVEEPTVRRTLLHLRLDDRKSRSEFAEWMRTQDSILET